MPIYVSPLHPKLGNQSSLCEPVEQVPPSKLAWWLPLQPERIRNRLVEARAAFLSAHVFQRAGV